MRRTMSSVALAAGVLGLARDAEAVPCSTLNGAIPIVWVENGDTQEPLMKRLGQKLVNSATPIRIVYKNRRTCDLATDMFTVPAKPIVNDAIPIRYVPTTGEDAAWDPSKPSPTCEADDPGGNAIDLGIGATFLSSCATLPAKPAGYTVVNGPVQAYGFVVPTASQQIALTAEEGYFAFGFAEATGKAPPWIDQNLRFIRGATASTALTTSAAIGLKAAGLKGTIAGTGADANTSDALVAAVLGSTDPDKTIGLLGTEVYDAKGRGKGLKLLAFKGFKQRYAYYPDSTASAFDKQNVRDGHYLPWSPTPYITSVDGTGKATNPNVQRLMDLAFGARTDADVNGLDQVIASGLVPECAMKVKRDFEGASLSLYSAPEPCGCYFEAKVPQGSTKCTACTDNGPCGSGRCRRGYCEAR